MLMPLIYFVLGILFIRCILPLCEQLVSWAVLAIERKKTKIAVRTTKLEKRIEEIVNEDNTPKARQIGFVVEDPSEYETQLPEEEEEEEC
jgi:hypothetical protein